MPDELKDCRTLKLILQPIVENAVQHGVRDRMENARIWLRVAREEGQLCVTVRDNGVGMTEAQIARVAYLVGHHHTLQNICGMDYQILIEADYIANASENGYGKESIVHFLDTIMKTASGKHLAASVLGIPASNLGCAGR